MNLEIFIPRIWHHNIVYYIDRYTNQFAYLKNLLEQELNKTNLRYRRANQALILKIDVPIRLTNKGMIAAQSTVDYQGLLQGGKTIAFDAKMCQSKTSFPLKNIHQHQLEYLKAIDSLGGMSFFLIQFQTLYDEAFKTPIDFIDYYWNDARDNGGRKSIPVKDFDTTWLVPIENYLKL